MNVNILKGLSPFTAFAVPDQQTPSQKARSMYYSSSDQTVDKPPPMTRQEVEESQVDKKATLMSNIIGIAMGILAVYLSWTCNTKKGDSTLLKVIYAIFAFLFAPLYLIIYLFIVRGTCGKLQNTE